MILRIKKTKILIQIFTLTLLLSSCAKPVLNNSKPDWVDNPGKNIVGKCATHVRGPTAQEQCAYKKGLSYIAMSKGVSVDVSSDMTIKQTSTQKTGKSYGKMQAIIKMDEKDIKVKASIIDKWHDKVSDVMYVLIKEE